LEISNDLKRNIASGLGLMIPTNMPLELYLDIAEDVRPRITSVVSDIVKDTDEGRMEAMSKIQTHIMSINNEVSRLHSNRRYMLLQAARDIYGRNTALINSALISGALGLAGGMVGCAGGIAVSTLGTIAAKKKWVQGGEPTRRFARKIGMDFQPLIDRVISLYADSPLSAVAVSSTRRTIEKASL
jgi:hypothetical protein